MKITPGISVLNAREPLTDDSGRPVPGTIGGFVYRNNKLLLLTCYHCVMNQYLDFAKFVPGNGNDTVNTVVDGVQLPLGKIVGAKMDSHTDSAIIEPFLDGNEVDETIPGIGIVAGKCVLTDADSGNVHVRKFGLISKMTAGEFNGISPSNGLPYPPKGFMQFYSNLPSFVGDIGFLAIPGDSGSFIVNDSNQVVAMVAITDGNITTYGMAPDYIEILYGVTFKK